MSTNEFRLRAYLKADLQRAIALANSSADTTYVAGLRLWLSMLSPRFMPVLLCRLAFWCQLNHLSPLAKLIALLNFVIFGIEISTRCAIGPGLFLPHTQGTVIGAWQIGANAIIYHGVTLGARELDFDYAPASRPVLADNVTIGSGAKVLGGISIGNGVRVGANAVVVDSLPPNCVAVGIPAKVIQK